MGRGNEPPGEPALRFVRTRRSLGVAVERRAHVVAMGRAAFLFAAISACALSGARADDAAAGATQTAGILSFDGIRIDPAARRIELEAEVNVTDAFLEYLAVGEGGKAHESLFLIRTKGEHLQLGLIALGLEPRPELVHQGEARALTGPRVAIEAVWTIGGERRSARVEDLVFDARVGGPLERHGFAFTGSRFLRNPAARRDPKAPREVLAASATGSVIALYHDPDAVLDWPEPSGGDVPLLVPTFGILEVGGWVPGDERFRAAAGRLPDRGTPCTLVVWPLGDGDQKGDGNPNER